MTSRGPDSAGFAIYGDEVPEGDLKVTLRWEDGNHETRNTRRETGNTRADAIDWQRVARGIGEKLGCKAGLLINANYAVVKVKGSEEAARRAVGEVNADIGGGLHIMSVGRSIEILKEIGTPQEIVDRFGVKKMKGTHVIGHTRMATESAVTTEGSHPFSTGRDLCLVHNGSLSNHNRLRENLRRHGIEFRTENDSEVAAGYLMWQMQQGKTLQQALESALSDLDGFYTFTIGTADGFAVLRDHVACKPAVMAETDQYVAMASEFQSLAALPGIDDAVIWEPKPGIVYTWGRENTNHETPNTKHGN
jgi:methylamine---glutamate N-methyltransferase subunit A